MTAGDHFGPCPLKFKLNPPIRFRQLGNLENKQDFNQNDLSCRRFKRGALTKVTTVKVGEGVVTIKSSLPFKIAATRKLKN